MIESRQSGALLFYARLSGVEVEADRWQHGTAVWSVYGTAVWLVCFMLASPLAREGGARFVTLLGTPAVTQ